MDISPLVPWLSAVSLLISIGVAVTAFLTTGAKQNSRQIADLEEDFEAIDRRVQSLEGEMRHLPDKDAVHRLELTLRDMQVEMAKIAASADQSARTTARVETYLLEKGA